MSISDNKFTRWILSKVLEIVFKCKVDVNGINGSVASVNERAKIDLNISIEMPEQDLKRFISSKLK